MTIPFTNSPRPATEKEASGLRLRQRNGFSLVELLVTIVILSILASMVVTAVSNAAVDSSKVLARQQQAAVQQALNSWVSTFSANTGGGIEQARTVYNTAGNSLTKFVLIAPFLEPSMATHIQTNSTLDRLESHALQRASAYLTLSGWSAGSYPTVNYVD